MELDSTSDSKSKHDDDDDDDDDSIEETSADVIVENTLAFNYHLIYTDCN